jgi:hydrocephalus-inducing protein
VLWVDATLRPARCLQGAGALPLRNVFPVEAEFLLVVDNPAFVVKPSEKLPARKSSTISIVYKAEAGGGGGGGGAKPAAAGGVPAAPAPPAASRTGKLTISCPKHTSCQWIYYLQA